MLAGDILFPLLLVCGLFGIILLVGIGFSYLWLVWLNKEATKCPACGKKGAGELIESQVTNSRTYTEWRGTSRRQQVRVTEKAYEDHFECQYCGHRWTTTAQEKKQSPISTAT